MNRLPPTDSHLSSFLQAKMRLRSLGLPITLFGEKHAQRTARLLLAEEDKGHHQDDFTLADGHNVVSEQFHVFFLYFTSLLDLHDLRFASCWRF